MRTVAILIFLGILPLTVLAAGPRVDFDGASAKPSQITNHFHFPQAPGRAKIVIATKSASGAWVRAKLLGIMCRYADVHSEGDAAGEVPHYHLALRGSPHAEDYESDPSVEFIDCCPTHGTPAPQECIDLGAGHPETLPVTSDCP